MSYSQWYLLKDLSDYGCIIYPCWLFLKLNMRNCGFLHQSEYYSVKNIFQKLSELNTFHLEIRQYFPYYCSELKTLEWDVLNPDRLINLEIKKKSGSSLIPISTIQKFPALIRSRDTWNFKNSLILVSIYICRSTYIHFYAYMQKLLWSIPLYTMRRKKIDDYRL